jgi:hypothetical protein
MVNLELLHLQFTIEILMPIAHSTLTPVKLPPVRVSGGNLQKPEVLTLQVKAPTLV